MKLTNHIKQQIVEAAIAKAGIPSEQEALRLRRAAWAESVRIDALGGESAAKKVDQEIEKIGQIRTSLPKNIATEGSPVRHAFYMSLNLAGIRIIAYFNGEVRETAERFYRPSPSAHTLLADNPLVEAFNILCAEQEELSNKQASIHANVTAALADIHSDTKLLKVWPEAAELLPEQVQKKQLPALATADLNALIGLPSEKEAA